MIKKILLLFCILMIASLAGCSYTSYVSETSPMLEEEPIGSVVSSSLPYPKEEAQASNLDPKNPVIVWKNVEFERLIRMALDKPDGAIYKNDLLEIYAITICGMHCSVNENTEFWFSYDEENDDLSYEWMGVTYKEHGTLNNLDDLINFPFLSVLSINFTKLESIEAIKFAPYLRMLTVRGNRVKSIEKLYLRSQTLEWLTLEGEQITDIGVLDRLWKLKVLSLTRCEIGDISSIKALTNLEYLYLSENNIADITALANVRSLKQIALNDNLISDISVLADKSEIEVLYLQNNQIQDLSPLQELTQIERLNLDNNRIEDITSLAKMNKLYWLSLAENDIEDISVLSEMSNLHKLFLYSNPISNIKPLAKLKDNLGLEIILDETEVSQADYLWLCEQLPEAKIIWHENTR